MASRIKPHHTTCHAHQFVHSLNASQRNALRVILAHDNGCTKLRRALGTEDTKPVSREANATALARTGRTIELFDSRAVRQ
jgi:hypothetical protein